MPPRPQPDGLVRTRPNWLSEGGMVIGDDAEDIWAAIVNDGHEPGGLGLVGSGRERECYEPPADDAPRTVLIRQRMVKVEGGTSFQLASVVAGRSEELGRCYASAADRYPHLRARPVARFSVDPRGSVQKVEILRTTIDDDVAKCLVDTMKAWRIPPHKGGKSLEISVSVLVTNEVGADH